MSKVEEVLNSLVYEIEWLLKGYLDPENEITLERYKGGCKEAIDEAKSKLHDLVDEFGDDLDSIFNED